MKQTEKPSDAELVRLAKAGDRDAMARIYETTYSELWRTARALVKNETDAADILQDAYLRAFTRLDQLSDPEALRPWLRQIAANTARNHLCRKKPLLFSELSDEDESAIPDVPEEDVSVLPEPALDKKETARLVREALDGLTDGQRLVMGLYYYEDQPIRGIAETLELSENTVKGQLRSGRKKVEETLRGTDGVKLSGLAPLALFRALLRQEGARIDTAAPARITSRIAAEGASALSGGTVRAVGAGSVLIKKVIVAAAAVAVLGGAVWGIGAIAGRNQPAPPDQIPDTALETRDPDAPRDIPSITTVIGRAMLDNDCGDYMPPRDPGSRRVTITFADETTGEESTRVVDLADTEPGEAEPEIRLLRIEDASSVIQGESEPVTDAADRAFLIGILRSTEVEPGDTPRRGYGLRLTVGDEACDLYPDGTVVSDRGIGTCDFFRASAIAWKYASPSVTGLDGQYAELRAPLRLRVMGEDNVIREVGPEPSRYKLCFTGPGLHVDLGVDEAAALVRSVMDLNRFGQGFTPAPFDWAPAGTPICMTEYLEEEPESPLYQENGTLRFWLYPDGTLALQKSRQVYAYSLNPWLVEYLEPEWDRPCILPNAFDWNALIAGLETLAAAPGEPLPTAESRPTEPPETEPQSTGTVAPQTYRDWSEAFYAALMNECGLGDVESPDWDSVPGEFYLTDLTGDKSPELLATGFGPEGNEALLCWWRGKYADAIRFLPLRRENQSAILLCTDWERRCFQYAAGVTRALGCTPEADGRVWLNLEVFPEGQRLIIPKPERGSLAELEKGESGTLEFEFYYTPGPGKAEGCCRLLDPETGHTWYYRFDPELGESEMDPSEYHSLEQQILTGADLVLLDDTDNAAIRALPHPELPAPMTAGEVLRNCLRQIGELDPYQHGPRRAHP